MARQHQKLLRRERAQTIAEPDAPALMPPGPASYDDAREICEPAPGSRAFAYQAELTPHFARCVSAVYYPNPSGGKIYGKDMQSAAVEANYDFLLRYFVWIFVANKPGRATREYRINYEIAGLAAYGGSNVLRFNIENVWLNSE